MHFLLMLMVALAVVFLLGLYSALLQILPIPTLGVKESQTPSPWQPPLLLGWGSVYAHSEWRLKLAPEPALHGVHWLHRGMMREDIDVGGRSREVESGDRARGCRKG